MFSPESHMDSSFGSQAMMPQGAKSQNPFHGIRRLAKKSMGFPKLGLAEQGMPDMAGAQPGQQAGTLFGSFGNQGKDFGFRAPKF